MIHPPNKDESHLKPQGNPSRFRFTPKCFNDKKCMICAQIIVPGFSVAQVARRYDLNTNQIFNWLKDPKFVLNDQAAKMSPNFCR